MFSFAGRWLAGIHTFLENSSPKLCTHPHTTENRTVTYLSLLARFAQICDTAFMTIPVKHSSRKALTPRVKDTVHFLRSWLGKPLQVGAVSPSSRFLARVMAGYVDPQGTGKVIEIGPGTGPVTQALLARGVAPERLVLIEYDAAFAQMLRHRFEGVTVIQGDGYALRDTLRGFVDEPVDAIVSSLPLMTRPPAQRQALLKEALSLMPAAAPFIQFTYALTPPIAHMPKVAMEGSRRIWRNIPPARVWVYKAQR
jgi:phosphatidylethanolamine/phosphatidyl-N-methylethanolamine N-methyltransferase